MKVFEAPLPGLDRPVGSSACYLRVNSPPLENQRPEHIEGMTEDELAKAKEHEDLEHEWVAPRALACLTPEIMSRLVSLKRLYLCKPSNGSTIDYDELYFSTPSDERILEEWSALLRVTRKTLQHLILDQRAVAPEDVGGGTDNRSYMRQCANGPSYDRSVKMVPPALLESKDCPNLKVIRLFGFEAHDEGLDEPYCEYQYVDHPGRSIDVPGKIRAAFPDAQVSNYIGRRLVILNESGEIESGKLAEI
jgi:hypothetical protein